MLPLIKDARRTTDDEQALLAARQHIVEQIESVEREMIDQRRRLLRRKEIQERYGLAMGEVQITDELISERTSQLREHVLSLQEKYQALTAQIDRAREAAKLQQDLGL